MSERQEHRRRFAARWDYLNRLDAWLRREPSKWRLVLHLRWKKERPVFDHAESVLTLFPVGIGAGRFVNARCTASRIPRHLIGRKNGKRVALKTNTLIREILSG